MGAHRDLGKKVSILTFTMGVCDGETVVMNVIPFKSSFFGDGTGLVSAMLARAAMESLEKCMLV